MQIQVDIAFDQLVDIVKHLPAAQKKMLRAQLGDTKSQNGEKEDFSDFLLRGPVFSDEQLEEIKTARKDINEWRKK